jgi:hypothetical protein
MEHMSLAEVKQALTTAAEQHNQSHYNHAFALHVRWEGDNTHAERDGANFQRFLDTFGLCNMEVLELASNDSEPGWTVQAQMRSIVKQANVAAHDSFGRSLVLFHYGGHGESGPTNSLLLSSPKTPRKINVDWVLNEFTYGNLDDDAPIDIIYIFDCCFGNLATRALISVPRVIEVIAAVDSTSPLAFIPGRQVSFTAKLAAKAHALRQQGYPSVEIAELIALLREESHGRRPSHALKLGTSSIRLFFPGSTPTPSSSLGHTRLRAVFQVNIFESFTHDDLKAFGHCIRSLPPHLNVTLEGVYDTSSTCIIVQAPYPIFSKLSGLPGVRLICEGTSDNRVGHHDATLSLRGLNVRGGPSTTENKRC